MSEEFETQLRESLRPIAPDADFTPRLLARLAERGGSAPLVLHHRPSRARTWWVSAALAASVIVAVLTTRHLQDQRDAVAGLEARRQVIEALYLTHEKLDLAYRVVQDESGGRAEPGA